jgi:hypothetical protein
MMSKSKLPTRASDIEELTQRANHLASECQEAIQQVVWYAVECGEVLQAVKAELGHGKWLQWLSEDWQHSERTAERYMQLAANRGLLEQRQPESLRQAVALIVETKGTGKPKPEPRPEPKPAVTVRHVVPDQVQQLEDDGPGDDVDDDDDYSYDHERPAVPQHVVPTPKAERPKAGPEIRQDSGDLLHSLLQLRPMDLLELLETVLIEHHQRHPERQGVTLGKLTTIRQRIMQEDF